jgi:hypothetical protein
MMTEVRNPRRTEDMPEDEGKQVVEGDRAEIIPLPPDPIKGFPAAPVRKGWSSAYWEERRRDRQESGS